LEVSFKAAKKGTFQRFKKGECDMLTSASRTLVELTIILGIFSITIGLLQKLINLTTVYLPHIMGLTPTDFLMFAVVCFLLALSLTGRQVLKYMEFNSSNSQP
jgi:amino acid permease